MRYSSLLRWLALLLMLAGLYLALPALAVENTTVKVSPESQRVSRGQGFTVQVVVDPKVAIAGVQFTLSFDPNLVTVNSVTEGNLLKQGGASSYFAMNNTIENANATGTINVAGAITTPGQTVSSAGTFAIIIFTAKTTDGTSNLNLSNVIVGDINGQQVPIQVTGGTLTVGAQPGDANSDGVINAVDITKVERIIATLDPSTSGADANQDGIIDALDITKVERKIAGLN